MTQQRRSQRRSPSQTRGQGAMIAVVGGLAAVTAFFLLRGKKPPVGTLKAVGEPTIT